MSLFRPYVLNWLLGLVGGFTVMVLLERRVSPAAPCWKRCVRAWALSIALWLVLYGALYALTSRLMLSLGFCLGFLGLVVIVSNAKYASLREPFTYQDFSYLTDAVRYPRLYLPFLGVYKGLVLILGVLSAVGLALWAESISSAGAYELRLMSMLVAGIGIVFLVSLGRGWQPILSYEPATDISRYGFWASLWLYQRALSILPKVTSPFSRDAVPEVLPNLVAVQSESFFDPRPLFSGVRTDVLKNFDRLSADAVVSGRFKVPAWGANTVRSEFAFLSGLDEHLLGVHRFNPYASVLKGWRAPSLVLYLKRLGYRTVCVHPYAGSFYYRDRVLPLLGFDALIDVHAFVGAERVGAYVSDAAVTDKVLEVLKQSQGQHTGPTFVFVITMENHGPLHFERVSEGDVAALYDEPPPTGCEDLTVYLRHLRNADKMIGRLCQSLADSESAGGRPGSLCWYGDHVPIMPAVYRTLGYPDQDTSYFFWDSRASHRKGQVVNLSAHDLAVDWVSRCVN